MLQPGKYVVYKVDDDGGLIELPEETYFLIKDMDVLGAMTLRNYSANAFQLIEWGLDPTTGKPLTDEQGEQLSLRADGVHALANKWVERHHKIPD